MKLIIYTDGGSRGNPGPSAIGVILGDREYSEYIGEATNNVAEYTAVIFALKKAKQIFGKDKVGDIEIEIRSDSELLVNQMNGEYKIKEETLKSFFIDIWNLKTEFKKISFTHIGREKNKRADYLLNKILDSQLF